MESSHVHKLSKWLGAHYDGDVALYDIRGYSAVQREVLTDEEMEKLTTWYYDGRCPVCGIEINTGEIICDTCFNDAARFPARADALLTRSAGVEER